MTENPLAPHVPLHFLIVEDDLFLSELCAEHYRELGFRVDVAIDGKAALAAMDLQRPDVVLCDRKMPEMSGSELLAELRGRGPEWQDIVFVFVTGLTDRRDRYAMLDLHPDGYLCKPIDFETEDFALAEILDRKRRAPKASVAPTASA